MEFGLILAPCKWMNCMVEKQNDSTHLVAHQEKSLNSSPALMEGTSTKLKLSGRSSSSGQTDGYFWRFVFSLKPDTYFQEPLHHR